MDTRMCTHTHICARAHTHTHTHAIFIQSVICNAQWTSSSLQRGAWTHSQKILYICLFLVSYTTNSSCGIKHMQESQILHHFMILCICIIKQNKNITWANNIIKRHTKVSKQIMAKTHFGVCGWGAEGGNRYDAKAKDKCLQNWHIKWSIEMKLKKKKYTNSTKKEAILAVQQLHQRW